MEGSLVVYLTSHFGSLIYLLSVIAWYNCDNRKYRQNLIIRSSQYPKYIGPNFCFWNFLSYVVNDELVSKPLVWLHHTISAKGDKKRSQCWENAAGLYSQCTSDEPDWWWTTKCLQAFDEKKRCTMSSQCSVAWRKFCNLTCFINEVPAFKMSHIYLCLWLKDYFYFKFPFLQPVLQRHI